jgi:hypothetical protein
VQPPGNHQVKHQPEIAFDADSDALTNTAQLQHYSTFSGSNRRACRSQQKGARNPDVFQRLPRNARFQRADIGRNVGQFRHRGPPIYIASQYYIALTAIREAEASLTREWGLKWPMLLKGLKLSVSASCCGTYFPVVQG